MNKSSCQCWVTKNFSSNKLPSFISIKSLPLSWSAVNGAKMLSFPGRFLPLYNWYTISDPLQILVNKWWHCLFLQSASKYWNVFQCWHCVNWKMKTFVTTRHWQCPVSSTTSQDVSSASWRLSQTEYNRRLFYYDQKGIHTILHGFNFMMRSFPNKQNYPTNWRGKIK